MVEQQIRPFLFEGEQLVRVVQIADAPWFVAADVCRVIGHSNPTKAVAVLDEDERTTLTFSAGGPDQNAISESGLYTLILRSHDAIKPGTVAHRFRKWVTAEVLPAIRQTGRYEKPQAEPDPAEVEDVDTADGIKLRKINTNCRCFGERAGAQLWVKLGMEIVPAMKPALAQMDMLETETLTITRFTNGSGH